MHSNPTYSNSTYKIKPTLFEGYSMEMMVDNSNKVHKRDQLHEHSNGFDRKNAKRKKKKNKRTVKEEDDIDKILAELGLGPVHENVQTDQAHPAKLVDDVCEKDGEEEALESAAAKKKRKRKEKEKEKKAALKMTDTTSVVDEKKEGSKGSKKIPKYVREIQAQLTRIKELVEKKKREEEEKLRKEEKERLRLEELERVAQDKKRLKKEREKEKLLKKRAEGKFLTGKQKEEARRREAMRNQILANAGGLPLPNGDGLTKRPMYETKKSKRAPAKGAETKESGEEMIKEVEELKMVDKFDVVDMFEQNGIEKDEEDGEWDAKSWDDSDLNLPSKSSFADEEGSPEPEPEPELVVKKEIKKSDQSSSFVVANKNKEKEVKDKTEEHKTVDGEKDLRAPICCIMGHVNSGKTTLLDCIRGTNVQEGEAGGITQQIGATYLPAENIRERTKELKADAKLNVPGLLVIDTPGHESFRNLRSRGSGLCDIAVLVVDIMHGLEPQTIESLSLLKARNTEFIVALNMVDKLYGWKTCPNAPIVKAMKQQSKVVQLEFNTRLTQVITEFKEQGLNTELYYKNKEMGEYFSIVPTSAISGEGIPDLLLLLVQWAQKSMIKKLTYRNVVECSVLEVKVIEGHGTTIDVVLVNGTLHEGDRIVVCGMKGAIETKIRALLTPHPMKELRVKGTYVHHKEIKAAQGIKIAAKELGHAIAGTALYVVGQNDNVDVIKESAMEDMRKVMNRFDKSGEGVYVQASTLGSLEALLEFLKTSDVNIPVSGIGIGPVHKKDVDKASVMLEKKKEFATILAFDVKVTPEAQELADKVGVKIFIDVTIYRLFDQFKKSIDKIKEEKKREVADKAVFPCVLKIMPNFVYKRKNRFVLGVEVLEGIVKVGTPICVPQKDFIDIGRIASIENNQKPVDYAMKGQKVAIKIMGRERQFGRDFVLEDELVSQISRESIDVMKAYFREDLSMEEWKLLVNLQMIFKV